MNGERSELWVEVMEFLLQMQKHPSFGPQTAIEAQRSLKCLPVIKNTIRSIEDDEKYIEMIIMADETEEFLNNALYQLEKKEKY